MKGYDCPTGLIKNPYIAYNESMPDKDSKTFCAAMYDFCPEDVDIAKSIMYNIEIVKISLFT